MEGRGLAKGNSRQQNAPRTQSRDDVPSALERVRQAARRDRKHAVHRAPAPRLRRRHAARGVLRAEARRRAGRGWRDVAALRRGRWRAISRTSPDGCSGGRTERSRFGGRTSRRRTGGSGRSAFPRWKTRSSSAPTVEVLNAIYETDFLGFSYGFRPGRSQHHALDALYVGTADEEGELGARCRHPWVLRHHRPRMAGEVRRAPDRGPARRAAHPEMAERRRAGGRAADAQ